MENKNVNGILIVDKPKNWTSHDVVAKLRNTLNIKKIGHGGTLDPEATGVLILLLGTMTKRATDVLGMDKEYLIDFILGRSTTTGDGEGDTIDELPVNDPRLVSITDKQINNAIHPFIGEITQVAPWYSAIKVNGKKLYQYARGKSPQELVALEVEVERPVRTIEVHTLSLDDFTRGTAQKYPYGRLHIHCSSGTYTRVVVEDLGKALDVPAYQTDLRRVRIGGFDLHDAVTVTEFSEVEKILPLIIPERQAVQKLSQ
ncbi:tRNA pseudouridine(55) synthase TruB [candidate division WWE3 bacterium]|uniref:tRNA pseudouridine synthase B n=1 Tax=candidate division WWE3 bacterium TaxID=2053526 RepID=A0A955RQN0_UNCKA|nr:tRNA pseudouridine(55) synthase TruB [candidate division WWE3 bacterium]